MRLASLLMLVVPFWLLATLYLSHPIAHRERADPSRSGLLLDHRSEHDKRLSDVSPPQHSSSDNSAELIVGVKVFLRLECARRFISSVSSAYPHLPLVVAYDGTEDYLSAEHLPSFQAARTRLLRMPFDSGAAAGRNAILDEAAGVVSGRSGSVSRESAYAVALCDSDTLVGAETRLESLLLDVLKSTDADVVAASCPDSMSESFSKFEFSLLDESQLKIVPGQRNPEHRKAPEYRGCFQVDFVKQCMLLIKSSSNVRWDGYLRNNDHYDFFLQLRKDKKKVYYCPDAKVTHDPSCGKKYAERYQKFRSRWSFFLPYVMNKWNLTRLQTGRNRIYYP